MKITLTTRKTLQAQAAERFEAAKKAKRKLDGARATIARFEKELPQVAAKAARIARARAWYEKFRWSRSRDGILLVGGRDAGTNEVLIKRHLEPTDYVVHTEAPGSPFVLVKEAANTPPDVLERALADAGVLCAAYSSAWKRGAATTDVFWVLPDQVSKTANTGEFIGKGAFMVRGEKHFLQPPVRIALGLLDGIPACGVAELFSGTHALLAPGDEKSESLAKKLITKLGGTADEWVPLIPAGGAKLTGWKRGRAGGANARGDEESDTDE
jgi:hypothetical protein